MDRVRIGEAFVLSVGLFYKRSKTLQCSDVDWAHHVMLECVTLLCIIYIWYNDEMVLVHMDVTPRHILIFKETMKGDDIVLFGNMSVKHKFAVVI